jgi:hypothetical protein
MHPAVRSIHFPDVVVYTNGIAGTYLVAVWMEYPRQLGTTVPT